MNQLRIFVSHSSQDKLYCTTLVNALRGAGADVWYDEQDLGAGHLIAVVNQELVARDVFIVILSKAAFSSQWVTQECQWAFNLYNREPKRVILPVTAQQIDRSDFNAWLFMEAFKRIEGPGGSPLPVSDAITKTLHALALDTHSALHAAQTDQPEGDRAVLWVDDIPSNNFYARRTLESWGIYFTISTSTDDALGKLIRHQYAAIISDMGRPGDDRAGYTLLEWARKLGVTTPFILYTGSRHPDHVAEAERRGAIGQTNAPDELMQLVKQALNIG